MLEMDNILVGICFTKNGNTFDKDHSWIEMSRYMNYAQVKVSEKVDIHLYAAASGRHLGLAGLKHGFSEAFEAYEYQKIYDDENSLIFYNNIKFENKEGYNYQEDTWYELERKFLYCINIEDFNSSAKILAELLELVGNSRYQDFQMMKYKVFGLFNSLYINILERKDIGDELLNINAVYHISNCKSIGELQSKANTIYHALEKRLISDDDKFSSNNLIQGVADYLKDNYSNPDLSMLSVADEFKISPAYLSRLFKQEIGIGPAAYLQKIRIEAVKEMLLNSDMTIKDISEAVGYQYVLTLNRNFKKIEGITPSQYIATKKYYSHMTHKKNRIEK